MKRSPGIGQYKQLNIAFPLMMIDRIWVEVERSGRTPPEIVRDAMNQYFLRLDMMVPRQSKPRKPRQRPDGGQSTLGIAA